MAAGLDPAVVLNFNVGVLGHVDSGKTSLARALSTTASTASFDKNPQSRERGITLDLGFSSFSVPLPQRLEGSQYQSLQITLVDCPGHASLIKTIIGGAQIIDLMLLVVDITKGVQTQTAECLVVGEITCSKMVVVLNKVDLLEDKKKEKHISKMKTGLSKLLLTTRFARAPIVAVAAKPGGPEADESVKAVGIEELIELLCDNVYLPQRNTEGPFVFAVDHCFPIKGQGTVMTGTVLQGSTKIGESVEIPALKVTKKVRSMQMYRAPVHKAAQGDRVGICVTQFDSKLLERGLVCSPGHLPTIYAGVARVEKIQYHKQRCATGAKFHITIGHETVMAKASFFGQSGDLPPGFSYDVEYSYLEELERLPSVSAAKSDEAEAVGGAEGGAEVGPMATEQVASLSRQWALLEFEQPVTCPPDCIVIGSRLDFDAFSNNCRIAFHGVLVVPVMSKDYPQTLLPKIKVYKMKQKEGVIERIQDGRTLIGRGLFKKETKIDLFTGMKVTLSTGERGRIGGSFGASGKYKVVLDDDLKPTTEDVLSYSKKKTKGDPGDSGGGAESSGPVIVTMTFKRYIYDPHKKMSQFGL